MARYSTQFLSQLLDRHDYAALVDLQGVAMGWSGFDMGHPTFGWPRPIFVVFELLTWLAQADRSGVWTYYEATPVGRLECAAATLDYLNAVELLQNYVYGKDNWRDLDAIGKLDSWISENEDNIITWAFSVLTEHPMELALVSS